MMHRENKAAIRRLTDYGFEIYAKTLLLKNISIASLGFAPMPGFEKLN